MSDSRPGLLRRLQQGGGQADWGRLVDLYCPHLFLWACRAGLQGLEAADLVREVFAAVARRLPEVRPGSPGGFRAWLRGLAQAQRQELLRKRKVHAGGPAAPAEAPAPPAADALWESAYLPFLLRGAAELIQTDLPAGDWKAFWALTVDGRPADEVAHELGVPAAVVYAAEARALRRLRQELEGLLD